jgi:hypothetical protein
MKKRQGIWMLAMLALALVSAARAQESAQSSTGAPDSSSDSTAQDTPQQIPPALPASGQDTTLPSIAENPPISGLDQPTLEPHSAPLSYIQPGATVSESVDSNVQDVTGGGAVQSVSRGLGSLQLQRLWSHYDLALEYIGGVAYYNQKDLGWKALQQVDAQQKVTWKRGDFSVRDNFSYLPEGNFGAAYGSLGSQGIASLGSTSFNGFLGGNNLGTLGLVPRISNLSVADVVENLTPKSTVTAAGGYAVTHFYGNDLGLTLLNNTEVSVQGGYDRLITPHTQVALEYGYEGFDFPTFDESFHSHVILGMYGHRITGRMDFLIGAGPQITDVSIGCTPVDVIAGNSHCSFNQSGNAVGTIPDRRIGAAGTMRLRYQFARTGLDLSYQRFQTAGSGFFAGAETDLAVLSMEHNLTRVWSLNADLGYSRNSRVLALTPGQLATCDSGTTTNSSQLPACPANANTYIYGFAGVALHRAFGHSFHGFVSYQFNELSFDNSYCAGLPVCNRIGNRSVGTIGLDWTPRPIRLD